MLKAENAAQQEQIEALEARLAALEQAVGVNGTPARPIRAEASPVPTTHLPAGWLLFDRLSASVLAVTSAALSTSLRSMTPNTVGLLPFSGKSQVIMGGEGDVTREEYR